MMNYISPNLGLDEVEYLLSTYLLTQPRALSPRWTHCQDKRFYPRRCWYPLPQSRSYLWQGWAEAQHQGGPQTWFPTEGENWINLRLHEDEAYLHATRWLQAFEEIQKNLLNLNCCKRLQGQLYWEDHRPWRKNTETYRKKKQMQNRSSRKRS